MLSNKISVIFEMKVYKLTSTCIKQDLPSYGLKFNISWFLIHFVILCWDSLFF